MEGNRLGIKKYDCTFKNVYNVNTINCIITYKFLTINNNTDITRNINDNLFGIRIIKKYGKRIWDKEI